MKTKEELNALKEEVETLNKKLAELSEDELKDVAGGAGSFDDLDEFLGWRTAGRTGIGPEGYDCSGLIG